MKMNNITQAILVGIGIVAILIYLESILIPLIFAVIAWFLIRELKKLMVRIPVLGGKLPVWLQNLVAFTVIIGTIMTFGMVLADNISQIYVKSPSYQQNIQLVVAEINKLIGVNVLQEAETYLQEMELTSIATSLLNSLSLVLSDIFLVIIYVIFLMAEESVIPQKLKNIYNTPERLRNARDLVKEISDSMSQYISLKALVSMITAVASYIALVFLGVDFPVFWAILIFLLNFIPTVGSLIATVFPALMALLQFAEFTPFILVLSIVGAIQLIVGNFLEPKLMGNSLNISSLVVIISLAFWGTIWGVVGMILSVPVTVMMIILFSKFDSTRSASIWLSGNGKID